ncbi:MAG: AbrB/MazE/SpoVT family DNA-binding domain-containing protein [Thermomicrobiales bacterium]
MGKVSSITSKGQVTIPKALRDELGLKPYDKVEFFPDGEGGGRFRKARPSLEELMGSMPLGISVEEAIKRAKEERAEYYAQQYRELS